jgi:hypothetical protein
VVYQSEKILRILCLNETCKDIKLEISVKAIKCFYTGYSCWSLVGVSDYLDHAARNIEFL